MPMVLKNQLLSTLQELMSAEEAEACLAEAMVATGLQSKQLLRGEEVAMLGEALMARAQQALAAQPVE